MHLVNAEATRPAAVTLPEATAIRVLRAITIQGGRGTSVPCFCTGTWSAVRGLNESSGEGGGGRILSRGALLQGRHS